MCECMYKRFFLFIVLVFLLMVYSSYGSCSLGFHSTSCDTITQGDFEIGIEPEFEKLSKDLRIGDRHSSNLFYVDDDKLGMALPYPGVYRATGTYEDLTGSFESLSNKNFVFDNSVPHHPRVPIFVYGDFTLNPQYHGDEVVIRDVDGDEIDTFVLSDGSKEISLDLDRPQLIRFETVRGNLGSGELMRYYYPEYPEYDYAESVGSVELDEGIMEDVNNVEGGESSRGDFFVTGSADAADGAIVYVNGQPIPVIDGEFGASVGLNIGENNIEVLGGSNSQNYNVEYNRDKFDFARPMDIEKVITGSQATISGSVTRDEEFLVYVDGVYVETVSPSGGDFSIELEDIESSRTLLQLRGPDGARFDTVIYRSDDGPEIDSENFDIMRSDEDLVFRISDDVGVNFESLNVEVDGESFSRNDIDRFGDFYSLSLNNIDDGSISVEVEVENRAGQTSNYDKEIEIDNDSFGPESIDFRNTDYEILGSHIVFGSKDNINMEVEMGEPYAFKSLRLNDYDQSNYRIYSDNTANIEFEELYRYGTIDLEYMNEDRETYTREYTYEVLLEPPVMYVESASAPVLSEDSAPQLGTGYVEDSSYINKNEISFNGNNPIWFGDSFETYVSPDVSNIGISGEDILGRGLQVEPTGNIDLGSSSNVISGGDGVRYGQVSRTNLDMSNPHSTTYISYGGEIEYINSIVRDDMFISPSQQQGIRATRYEGVDMGGSVFTAFNLESLDSSKPRVYQLNDNPDYNRIIIDGIHSSVDEGSLNIEGPGTYSSCGSGETWICRQFDTSIESFEIEVEDEAGNILSEEFSYSSLPSRSEVFVDEENYYFTRNVDTTTEGDEYIQGQYMAKGEVDSIESEFGDCYFDSYNFVCPVPLDYGLNEFDDFIIKYQDGTEDEIPNPPSINKTEEPEITLESFSGDGVFDFGGTAYYFGSGEVQVEGYSEKEGIITIEVGGREVYVDEDSAGDFSYEIGSELEMEVQDYDYREMNVRGRIDSDEGKGTSNILDLIYANVRDVLVSIVVE